MRYNVTVDIPYLKKLPYTLYSKGMLTDIPYFDKNEDFCHFKYLGGTVFVLFYTFEGFRRAYIVTCWQDEKDGEAITLPGVDQKLCLIFTARGRKVDNLRRVIYILTDQQGDDNKVFKLPLMFWYKLAALIQQTKAVRSDVALLWETYTNKKLLKLSKKEIQKKKGAV